MANTFGKFSKTKALRNVMSKAWEIFKANVISFSEALKQAWTWLKTEIHRLSSIPVSVEEVAALLRKDVIEFGYYKLNGEYRVFKATLKRDLLPNNIFSVAPYTRGSNLRFFDFNANGWRSIASETRVLYVMV